MVDLLEIASHFFNKNSAAAPTVLLAIFAEVLAADAMLSGAFLISFATCFLNKYSIGMRGIEHDKKNKIILTKRILSLVRILKIPASHIIMTAPTNIAII